MKERTHPDGSDLLLGTVLGERYRLDGVAGEGGMGRVYIALHTMLHKRLAVKVIHPRLAKIDEVVARFEREAIAAAHMEHPNAVSATDFGRTADDRLFLVMEWVGGQSLQRVIARAGGRLSPLRVVHIIRQVLRALRRAHSLGIVHRDIKPDNVMLVERDGDPDFVKVMDFGIAKLTSTSRDRLRVTRNGLVCGTPAYMSPEQAKGAHIDARTDLYAVGTLMFEMLCGRVPFDAPSPIEVLEMQLHSPAPSPSSAVPGLHVPAELEALVLKLLAKSPEDRCQSAGEVLEALDRVALPQADPLIGATLSGYTIRRRIGESRLCLVYEALTADGRRVALKVLRPEWANEDTVAERFIHEMTVAASLGHANTIEILDFGRAQDGTPFLSMELIEGETLASRLRRLSRLPAIDAAQVAEQIAESLCEAHAKRIVHRDLRPEHVMLSPGGDGSPHVTVLGYGLAGVAEACEIADGTTASWTRLGTAYGLPEAAGCEDPEGSCDLYALGVILYEMLAGRAPFTERDVLGLRNPRRGLVPPPLDTDVPLSLAMVAWQMLEVRPNRRGHTAEDVRAVLREWLVSNGAPARGSGAS